jgi:transposase
MTGLRHGFRFYTMCFPLTLEAYTGRSRGWMTSCGTCSPPVAAPKPRRVRCPGRRPLGPRQVRTGSFCVLKSGMPWHMLPQAPCPAGDTGARGSGLGVYRWVVARTLSWLHQLHRPRIRYERRLEIHEAFLTIGCALICWRFL